MAEVTLSNGMVALLDSDDLGLVSHLNWRAEPIRRASGGHYAVSERMRNGIVTRFRMHRLVLQALPGQEVDHVNGDGLDNRRANLRIASRSENACNRRSPTGGSGFLGVTRQRKKWQAQIELCGKPYYLGVFETPEEAAAARDQAALRLHGKFAVTNEGSQGRRAPEVTS